MPSTFSSTFQDRILQINSPSIDLKKGTSLPHLSLGEVVEVDVLGKFDNKKLVILLKNAKILADSEIPFRQGERIRVKVKQLYPNIILHFVQKAKKIENPKIADYVRFYRSDPKALYKFFMQLAKEFSHETLGEIISFLGKENLEGILNILNSLMISKESLGDELFFKDDIYRFGYLLEKELKDVVNKGLNRAEYPQTLKGFLIKISDKLKLLRGNGDFPGAEKLSRYIESSLKTIESHQVINYLFQQYEGKYMFQLPILFPGSMGLAEIFIKSGDKRLGNRDGKKHKILLFLLTMDALGDIVIEVKIVKKNIGCLLKCENNNLRNFIAPYLDGLGKKLSNLEYKVDYLKCIVEKGALKRDEYREFQNIFAQEEVDFLA